MFHIASANLYNVYKVVYDNSGEGMLELLIGSWAGWSDDAIDTVCRLVIRLGLVNLKPLAASRSGHDDAEGIILVRTLHDRER